jgi:hypothetical protein
MKKQTTKEKLKAVAQWLGENKDIFLKEHLSVQFAVLSPAEEKGKAHAFGVYAINEMNLWQLMYDVIYEFYKDNPDYDSFYEYMDDLREQFLEWFEKEDECETISYSDHEGTQDLEDEE